MAFDEKKEVLSNTVLKFSDGEYLHYLYASHSFLEDEDLDSFFEDLDNFLGDPYDGYVYEIQLVRYPQDNNN